MDSPSAAVRASSRYMLLAIHVCRYAVLGRITSGLKGQGSFAVGTDPHAPDGKRDVRSGNTGQRISIIPLNCGEMIP